MITKMMSLFYLILLSCVHLDAKYPRMLMSMYCISVNSWSHNERPSCIPRLPALAWKLLAVRSYMRLNLVISSSYPSVCCLSDATTTTIFWTSLTCPVISKEISCCITTGTNGPNWRTEICHWHERWYRYHHWLDCDYMNEEHRDKWIKRCEYKIE